MKELKKGVMATTRDTKPIAKKKLKLTLETLRELTDTLEAALQPKDSIKICHTYTCSLVYSCKPNC